LGIQFPTFTRHHTANDSAPIELDDTARELYLEKPQIEVDLCEPIKWTIPELSSGGAFSSRPPQFFDKGSHLAGNDSAQERGPGVTTSSIFPATVYPVVQIDRL